MEMHTEKETEKHRDIHRLTDRCTVKENDREKARGQTNHRPMETQKRRKRKSKVNKRGIWIKRNLLEREFRTYELSLSLSFSFH